MRLKNSSVKIDNLSQEIKSKFNEIDKIFLKYADREAIVTSGNDSGHSEHSLHYHNKAIDLRCFDIKHEICLTKLLADLRKLFPKPEFDVLYEYKTDKDGKRVNPHIHIEENW